MITCVTDYTCDIWFDMFVFILLKVIIGVDHLIVKVKAEEGPYFSNESELYIEFHSILKCDAFKSF